ncbi:MAG TPA: MATE family efflux transporter [Aliidongia sp.]|uniref:MATE family efflux transporter n=1 Tax=Aliidongia sp. TaxID=1914230 RepID=UPI002DDD5083|nr:MATE family efflux transporter [Aliidongia sp.]HEV2677259.1 MATE family efflux transporter [Aliidongia sp.]
MTSIPMSSGRPSRRRELAEILGLAIPLAAGQVATMLMSITDSVMLGHLSSEALAAGGLGANLAFMLIILMQGLQAGIQPLIAQARGAGDAGPIGRAVWGGLLIGGLAVVPIMLLLGQADLFLRLIGEPQAIAGPVMVYERAFLWSIPAAALMGVLRYFLSAMERPRVAMLVAMGGVGVNLLLNWILIFGNLGAPAFGLAGSGYATSVTWGLMALALTIYIAHAKLLPHDFWRLAWVERRRGFFAVFRLGWPIAGIYAVEVGLFSVSSLLMGWFGPVAVAAHQICLGVASLTFMVPLAIGQAATVRVGFHMGAGAVARARLAGFSAIGLGIGFMSCTAVAIAFGRRLVFAFYLDGDDPNYDEVVTLGVDLLAVACVFQMFDGAQVVAAGALRGLKDTRVPMLLGALGYWGLGMTIGAGLAFGIGFGPIGLWWGFVCGLATVSVLLCLRFRALMGRYLAVQIRHGLTGALAEGG